MLAKVHAGCLAGVGAHGVEVEVHLGRGLPGFDIVGLPEASVRESRVRVKAALINSGFEPPKRMVVLNLAPADLPKRGSTFDLAIAVAVITAAGACSPDRLDHTLLLGELSLDGALRSVRGLLPQLFSARARGLKDAIVPHAHRHEAGLVEGISVRTAERLEDVVAHLDGALELPLAPASGLAAVRSEAIPDLADVRGQRSAKRALEIAASGGHDLLLIGPPGAGKTMLARRLPGILPSPSAEEILEIATILSASGRAVRAPIERPFRAPHHTASAVALIGGGDPIRPGEVTLAHGGVLFLDELPEFPRHVIEVLRTTMETGEATIARARHRITMPARPLLVAAMNPCPCGYAGDPSRECARCPGRAERYQSRVSGPLLDRFDLHVSLPPVDFAALNAAVKQGERGEPSEEVRARVLATRARAAAAGDLGPDGRRPLGAPLTDRLEGLEDSPRNLLERAGTQLGLSMRGFAKVLAVARTLAHMDAEEAIGARHIAEALSYRVLDRRKRAEVMPIKSLLKEAS